MQDLLFYLQLGFEHVLDPSGYDHILFLFALAVPFAWKSWKKLLILATVFTVFHCISLAVSAYDLLRVDVGMIEFLIPLTILLTALFNFFYLFRDADETGVYLHLLATAFFGLIHGFGFSNYFNLIVADLQEKSMPLIGFALGIEFAQVLVVTLALLLMELLRKIPNFGKRYALIAASILVVIITIPLLIDTFPF